MNKYLKKLNQNEILFLLGLFTYTVGQYLIFIYFNDLEKLHNQEPIDFAHWLMIDSVFYYSFLKLEIFPKVDGII